MKLVLPPSERLRYRNFKRSGNQLETRRGDLPRQDIADHDGPSSRHLVKRERQPARDRPAVPHDVAGIETILPRGSMTSR